MQSKKNALNILTISLIIISLGLVYYLCVNAYFVGFFNDDAFYIIGSRSLLQGHYVELNQPGHPPLLSYTPGYPLLLTLITLFSGDATRPYQIFSVFTSLMCILLIGILYRKRLSRAPWAALLIISALNPLMVSMSGTVLSDLPYLLFSLVFFIFLREGIQNFKTEHVLVIPILAGLCFYIRPIGGILIMVLIFSFISEKKWKEGILSGIIFSMFVGPYLIWNLRAGGHLIYYFGHFQSAYSTPHSYSQFVHWLRDNLIFYSRELFVRNLFRWPFQKFSLAWNFISVIMGIGFTGWGIHISWRDRFMKTIAWYIFLYFLVLELWPQPASRYLLPIFPFIISFFLIGLYQIVEQVEVFSFPFGHHIIPGLAIFMYMNPLGTILAASLRAANIMNSPPHQTIDWVKSRTAESDIFGAQLDGQFYLLTGRMCYMLPKHVDADQLDRWAHERQIKFVLLKDPSLVLKTHDEAALERKGIFQGWYVPSKWEVVFESQIEKSVIFDTRLRYNRF